MSKVRNKQGPIYPAVAMRCAYCKKGLGVMIFPRLPNEKAVDLANGLWSLGVHMSCPECTEKKQTEFWK